MLAVSFMTKPIPDIHVSIIAVMLLKKWSSMKPLVLNTGTWYNTFWHTSHSPYKKTKEIVFIDLS